MVVVVQNLQLEGHYNDTRGTVLGWDNVRGAWKVKLDLDGTIREFYETNLIPNEIYRHHVDSLRPATGIAEGVRCRIVGLPGNSKYNKVPGTVRGFDSENQRWKVQLDTDGTIKELKESYLKVIQEGEIDYTGGYSATGNVPEQFFEGDRVVLKDLVSEATLNGTYGSIVAWDTQFERFRVKLESGGKTKALRAQNITKIGVDQEQKAMMKGPPLAGGVRVKIIGLSSAPEYNDTFGTVRGWDEKYGRWQVKLDFDGKTKAFKDNNISSDGVEQPIEPQRRTSVAVGAHVRIIGMAGAQLKYNNTLASVVRYDDKLQRWKIKFELDGTEAEVKGENITLEDLPPPKKAASEKLAVEQHGTDALTQTHKRVVGGASASIIADKIGVELAEGARVRIVGLDATKGRGRYNNTLATLLVFDEKYQRWQVHMDLDDKIKILSQSNFETTGVPQMKPELAEEHSKAREAALKDAVEDPDELKEGARVRILGLEGVMLGMYNGSEGTVVKWHAKHERWEINMDLDGRVKALDAKHFTMDGVQQPVRRGAQTPLLKPEEASRMADELAEEGKLPVEVIDVGVRVMVFELNAHPEYNGENVCRI